MRFFRRRRLIALMVFLVVSVLIAYFAASEILYVQLATVLPHCDGTFSTNTPAIFSADPYGTNFDTTPYLMPDYESVEIASRDAGITLSGWFVPANGDSADSATVIVIHGLGVGTTDCKRSPRALLAAGMLNQAGFNVLLIDLRQHGDLDDHNGDVGSQYQ